jgi:metallo-beta-lactamase class B
MRKLALSLLALSFGVALAAQNKPDWTIPIAPFRIADGLYYVGTRDLASYLVVTSQGNILINSGLESSPTLIRSSIEQLGFKYTDTRILLISHAHWDHDAGSARVIQETGARYMVMDDDVPVVESGGALDFAYADSPYPKAKVDRVLHDGDEVKLADATLVAHKTPGHTRGCTTWTMKAKQNGRTLDAVIVGSWNVNAEYRLVDKPQHPASYPGIVADYRKTFALLKKLPCDLFLGAHGDYFNLLEKLARARKAGESVWIDPEGYQAKVAEREQVFEAQLHEQQR